MSGQAAQLRISALTDALFEPNQPVHVIPDPIAPNERAILVPFERAEEAQSDDGEVATLDEEMIEKEHLIRQTWTRYCARNAHEQRKAEGRQLLARVKALAALRELSEFQYQEAIKIDYSLAPQRRIATLTMPHAINLSDGDLIVNKATTS